MTQFVYIQKERIMRRVPTNRRHVFIATLFLDQTGRMSYAPLWFVTLPEMEFRAEHYGVATTWCSISTWMTLCIK